MSQAGLPLPHVPARPHLRPLGFGELLDQVFRLYRANFGVMLAIALIVLLPVLVAQVSGTAPAIAFDLELLRNPYTLAQQPPPSISSLYNLPPLIAGYGLLVLALPFTMASVVVAGLSAIRGVPPSLGEVFGTVGRRYGWLFLLGLLFGCGILVFCCLPLWIWLMVRFSVAVPAMMAERLRPIAALKRSWRLTSGGWWRAFGVIAVLYLIGYVIGGILGALGLPIAIAMPFIPAMVRAVVVAVVSTLGSAFTFPLLSLATTLLYIDFRVRREAYDLEELAREAAQGAGG